MNPINVYCDESGHLEFDQTDVMTLGAIWLPREKVPEVNLRVREIKSKYQLPTNFEIKWTKISPGLVSFYNEIVDYFFDDDDLHCRIVVIGDKTKLNHTMYDQDHDTWYFKMYFVLLSNILNPTHPANIYIDVKDTRSAPKTAKLKEVLASSQFDYSGEIVQRLQAVRSDEIPILQMCDLLMGAVAASNRGTTTSQAKMEVINRVATRSRRRLSQSTWPSEKKFNLFHWQPGYRKRGMD